MLKARGVHHVAIICSNYERSKKFYVGTLGFSIIRETLRKERNSWKLDLKVNEHTALELFSFPNPPARPSRPEACGLRHLAFAVDNLEEAIASLRAKGVGTEPVRVDELTGQRFTFFADPDGLPLEIYQI